MKKAKRMQESLFGETAEYRTLKELKSVSELRYGNEANELRLLSEEENPCSAVLMNIGRAVLIYFSED